VEDPVVLGLDFGGSKIAAAAAALDGRRLRELVVATDPAAGARANLARGIAAAHDVLGGRTPAAVGAVTFGIPRADGIGLAPAIAGWEELALADELAAGLACETVVVDTDVKAAAAVEAHDGALAGHDPALYVNLGTGLAAALVVGGTVVRGANGAAGEIGYSLLDRAAGRVLEDVASGMGLAAAARRATGEALSAAEVFARERDEPVLAAVVDELVAALGLHLVNLAVALDPSRIAVGGGIVRAWDRIGPRLVELLHRSVPYPPELVRAAFPFDAALRGAVAAALDALGGEHAANGKVNSNTVAARPGREQR
jgi:glucokinase